MSKPVSFGSDCAWMAVKGTTPKKVAEAMGLSDVRDADWEEGVRAAYDGDVFVASPVDGWVLAVSASLPEAEDEALLAMVREMSAKLHTIVQYFCSHGGVEYHGWVWAQTGRINRAYAYLGEDGKTMLNEGAKMQTEIDLGFEFFDSYAPDAKYDDYWDRDDLRAPETSDVMKLAARWSVDPSKLGEREIAVEPGLLGVL